MNEPTSRGLDQEAPLAPQSHRVLLPQWAWFLGVFGMLVLAGGLLWSSGLLGSLEQWVSVNEQRYAQWMKQYDLVQSQAWLIPVAFAGGLISSLAPCILALVPVNMTYIGTMNATSQRQALWSATSFVLGVVVILSAFGLVSAFAGAVTVAYKGYIQMVVGALSLILGLGLLGVYQLKIPSRAVKLTRGTAPFLVGVTFATVTSPCASPVLASLLLTAGSTGNPVLSVATMTAYALGYTFIVFLASVCTSISKQVSALRPYATLMNRIGSVLLIAIGVYYGVLGWRWMTEG